LIFIKKIMIYIHPGTISKQTGHLLCVNISVNKHRKVPFPAELTFAFVWMSCKRNQKG